MTNNVCVICYDVSNVEVIKCSCDCCVCFDCMTTYIEVCNNNNQMVPKCPNTKCNKEYLYESLKILPKNILISYSNLIYKYIKNNVDFTTTNSKIEEMNILIDKIKKEKTLFLEKNYPKCISKTIEICYKSKLNKITKSNRQIIDKELKEKN